jgi:hypothetical protein
MCILDERRMTESERREAPFFFSHSFLINDILTQNVSTNRYTEIVEKKRWGHREQRERIEEGGLRKGERM